MIYEVFCCLNHLKPMFPLYRNQSIYLLFKSIDLWVNDMWVILHFFLLRKTEEFSLRRVQFHKIVLALLLSPSLFQECSLSDIYECFLLAR